MDLGDKIKSALADIGLTRKELAEKAGLTERTIQRIENYEVEPSVYSLNKKSIIFYVDLKHEKTRIMKRRNRIIYSIMVIWTIALLINLILTPFDLSSRWWEILIWLFILVGVIRRQIYIPYRKKKTV